MKITKSLLTAAVFLVSSFIIAPALHAANPCDDITPTTVRSNTSVQNLFDTYPDNDASSDESNYLLCLNFVSGTQTQKATLVFTKLIDGKDVYISGLNIKANSPATLLEVYNPDPDATVHILDSTLEGSAKSGNCFEIYDPKIELDNVEAVACAEGVKVMANRISITNSRIHSNGIGIHILPGIVGTRITGSVVYDNTDESKTSVKRLWGILVDPVANIARDLKFYSCKGCTAATFKNEALKENALQDGVHSYAESEDAYIKLPEAPTGSGKIELYKTDEKMMQANGATSFSIQIDPVAMTRDKRISSTIPPELLNKTLVAVYSDPTFGSTVISEPLVATGAFPEFVAFVTTPYDIPTPGGGVADSQGQGSGQDDDSDSDSADGPQSGGNSVGGETAGIDVGPALTEAAGASAKCALSPLLGDTFRTVSFGMNVGWMILVLGLLGGMRGVLVRRNKDSE